MSADLDDRVEAWIEAEWSEYAGQLTPSDLRRGIQGLSGLYVHDRSKGQISARAGAGVARRAAFSVYFAPLHFLTVWWGLASAGWPDTAGRTILDLGAGSAAAGAAVAAFGGGRVVAIDRTPWSPPAARRTLRALRLSGTARQGSLPGAMGWPKRGEVLVFGWSLNELDPPARADVVRRVEAGLRKGGGVLIAEPISRRIAPWWDDVHRRLAAHGVEAMEFKQRVSLPPRLAALDKAAGLDHSELKARFLVRAPA